MSVEQRRELDLINKQIHEHHRKVGQYIVWFELKAFGTEPGDSSYDDIYDEGNGVEGRKYAPGKTVPVIYAEEIEDESRAIEDARQPTQNLHVTIAYTDKVSAGINAPREYQPHLNDMFMYDDRFYDVYRCTARGHLHDEVLIAVEGVEVYPEQELKWDTAPVVSTSDPWPDTLLGAG